MSGEPVGPIEPPVVEEIRAWVERDLPVSGESGDVRLLLIAGSFDPAVEWDPTGVRIYLSYAVFERAPDGQFQIRDVKEQQVFFFTPAQLADPRLPQAWSGWIRALQTALTAVAGLPTSTRRYNGCLYECLMPFELAPGAVLDLRRPRTEDDFYRACLASRRRLKRLLGP